MVVGPVIVPFKALPGQPDSTLRPALSVALADAEDLSHLCLIDTGSLHNRFGRWVADLAGVDLSGGTSSSLALGGLTTAAVTVPLDLLLGGHRWRAPVSFCDPWPFGFHLLGQEGFFRFFEVTIRATAYTVEVQPDLGPEL